MNCHFVDTGQTITRGTAFPLTLTLPFDVSDFDVTFTMRASIADNGNPILQCNNEDIIHMNIHGNTVIINLSEADTWKIPEKAPKVFIQLNLTRLIETSATKIYALEVLPNIMKQGEQPR